MAVKVFVVFYPCSLPFFLNIIINIIIIIFLAHKLSYVLQIHVLHVENFVCAIFFLLCGNGHLDLLCLVANNSLSLSVVSYPYRLYDCAIFIRPHFFFSFLHICITVAVWSTTMCVIIKWPAPSDFLSSSQNDAEFIF